LISPPASRLFFCPRAALGCGLANPETANGSSDLSLPADQS
jgi:hypothetical protein